jgi:hypothetical protein
VVLGIKAKGKAGNDANRGKIQTLVTLGFIVMIAGDAISHVIAPWFGPVSVYWPTFCASKLLFNMLFIGVIMQHEKFDKNAQVATGVIVAGAVTISINGPGIQEDQNVNDLVFGNPIAITWLAFLLALFIICSFLMLFTNLKKRSHAFAEIVLFIVFIDASALAGTTSKFSSTFDGSEGPYRAILLTITWIIIAIWAVENFKEATHVRSLARFIPQATFGSIALNGVTGVSDQLATLFVNDNYRGFMLISFYFIIYYIGDCVGRLQSGWILAGLHNSICFDCYGDLSTKRHRSAPI